MPQFRRPIRGAPQVRLYLCCLVLLMGEGAQPAFGPERIVKRMYTARIIVLIIALGAGGLAAYLASGSDNKSAAPVQPTAQLETVDVLVAKSDIGLGQTTKPDDLQWQTWPKSTASGSF